MNSIEDESVPTTTTKYTGIVKWFNNKAGYGFVTILDDGDYFQKDIFAHYSSIVSDGGNYKYLVQGEYVELAITTSLNDKYKYHAVQIHGIRGGPLMCESNRSSVRSSPQTSYNSVVDGRPPRRPYVPRDGVKGRSPTMP